MRIFVFCKFVLKICDIIFSYFLWNFFVEFVLKTIMCCQIILMVHVYPFCNGLPFNWVFVWQYLLHDGHPVTFVRNQMESQNLTLSHIFSWLICNKICKNQNYLYYDTLTFFQGAGWYSIWSCFSFHLSIQLSIILLSKTMNCNFTNLGATHEQWYEMHILLTGIGFLIFPWGYVPLKISMEKFLSSAIYH